MRPRLDAELEQLRSTVLDLASSLPAPSGGRIDRASWRRCASVGLTGLTIAPEHGGQGAGPRAAAVALEAFGEGCVDEGLAFSIGAHLWAVATPIARFARPELQARWLPGLCDGSLIGAHAMSEPDAGSDAMSLTTRAEPDGDGWRITGEKTWCTNAPDADVMVVFATVDQALGWAGVTPFVVGTDTAGVDVSPPMTKLGLEGSPMGHVHLDGVAVGPGDLLGKRGGGMAVFTHAMEWERAYILAPAVGTMQRLLDIARDHARSREQFGQKIGAFQGVSHRIADMHARVSAARALLHQLAANHEAGRMSTADAATAKLFISERFVEQGLDAVQVLGGLGYLPEGGVESALRASVASRIYSGTSELQRNLIARSLKVK